MARLYGPEPGEPPPLIATEDLAGLSVDDVDGRPVGGLVGALSEKRTGLIRYLDLALADRPKHVLVPIGHARFERQRVPPRVRLRAATHEDLHAVPAYDGSPAGLDAGYQESVLQATGRLFYGSRYYAHPAFDHAAIYPGDHAVEGPEPGAGEPETPSVRPLSDLPDFRVAKGQPDIRGLPLKDARGETVGEITELLVDPRARKTRYAVIRLADLPREAALPIGYLDAGGDPPDDLVTPALRREDIRLLPAYEPPMDRQQENRIHATLEGRLSGSRYFQRPDFRGTDATLP